jgi:phosphatidylglycerol lysyltransferase
MTATLNHLPPTPLVDEVLDPFPPAPQDIVSMWGRSSVSPFTIGADREVHELPGGGLVGFVRKGRFAVMATDPIAPPGREDRTLDEALELLRSLRLKPVVVAATDPAPYVARGLFTMPVADDPTLDLSTFSLSGKRRSSIRHSVTSARRAGLTVRDWSPELIPAAAEVSAQWLATKRGGEMGFTLGRFDPDELSHLDCRVALDGEGRVVGLVTWHRFDNGDARVLDLMRRVPDAPNPTMDLLVAQSLLDFAGQGVRTASLGSVPRSHGNLAEKIYPTVSLRRYKDKYAPQWSERHLVTSGRASVPGAMLAVAKSFSPDGLIAACRHNR